MAACSLFEEDEVYRHKPGKGYNFGIVLENSEFLSSSEEDEVSSANDRLRRGTVRVSWHPTGKETVVAEDKVKLLDRSLLPGDVVKRLIPGMESQCGFVMNMDVRCHLRVLRSSKYIYCVDSKDLEPLQKFECGQEVMLDSWLGRLESFDIYVILLFQDGARCMVGEGDLFLFDDIFNNRSKNEFSVCPFFAGQELKGPLDCLCEAKWLHSTSRHCHRMASRKGKKNMVYATVEKIVYKNVEIHWLSRGFEKGDSVNEAFSPPPSIVEGPDVERLKVLNWFSHCSIQIGDHMSYRIKNDDVISTSEPSKIFDPKSSVLKSWTLKSTEENELKKPEEPANMSAADLENEVEEGDEVDFEDVDDADKSDLNQKSGACGGSNRIIGWYHGKKRNRVIKLMGQRHKPLKPVLTQKLQGKKPGPKEHIIKPGDLVEVEIELTASWATVMWQDGTVERDIPSAELFPVHHLDELEFFPGDFILPNVELPEPVDYGVIVRVDHAERTCLVHWLKAYEVGKAQAPTVVQSNCEISVYDITDHPDYKFRPGQSIVRVGGFEHLPTDSESKPQAVGQIFEIDPNGHLVVKWADGRIGQCYPQEVYIISEDDADASSNGSLDSWATESEYETDGSEETWETQSENEIIGEDSDGKNGKDESGIDQGVLCEHRLELDSLLCRAETALVRLQKLLNVFDISAVSVPECFHDIIRIYRSCHDLDRILQSSFFVDPELQSLISQAKKEMRRDKANKISKHLSQLFEAWSNSLPTENADSVSKVALSGISVHVGAHKKGTRIEVSLQIPTGEGDNSDTSFSIMNSGAAGGISVFEGSDSSIFINDSIAGSDLNVDQISSESLESKRMIKESSEPTISDCGKNEPRERRPSDPFYINATLGAKKKKSKDINLVGENCVSKAAKRTKSDGFDDSGHEAKKSRDETVAFNHVAQELCYKICQNLQKQILKIHEEVNKRTKRLMNVSVKRLQTVNGKTESEEIDKPSAETENINESVNIDHNMAPCQGYFPAENDHLSPTGNLVTEAESQKKPTLSSLNEPTFDSAPPADCHREELMENQKPDLENPKAETEERQLEELMHPPAVCEKNQEVSISNSSVSQKEEIIPSLGDVSQVPCKGFDMHGEVLSCHKYIAQERQPANPRAFRTAIRKELKLFQTSLPDGIFIKGFEDRLDLYSVMILGPSGTPYEDAVFLFDMMLPNDYPNAPPLCHYYSYCSDRLNPNLYEDGKVCVSLLGTWSGKGTEVWTSKSNLLQVLVSIQGLILVQEPYYNEAGYERQRGTQVGQENSRMYSEMAILKTVQSLTKMCHNLPIFFKEEIYEYLKVHGPRMISRLRYWMSLSEHQRKQPVAGGSAFGQSNETQPQEQLTTVSQQAAVETDAHSEKLVHSNASCDNLLHNGALETSASNLLTDVGFRKSDTPENNIQNTVAADCDSHNDETPSFIDCQCNEAIHAVSALHIGSLKINSEQPKDDVNKFAHVNGAVSDMEVSSNDGASQITNGKLLMPHPSVENVNCEGNISAYVSSTDHNSADVLQGDNHNSTKTIIQDDRDLAKSRPELEPKESQPYGNPEFPLFPMSRGFCLTLQKYLNLYESALQHMEPPKHC